MNWQAIVQQNNVEASEIFLSGLFGSNRIDAECYQKKFLKNENAIKDKTTVEISKVAKITDGDHSKFPDNQEPEVRYLRSKDIKSYFLVDDDPIFVSNSYFEKLKRSQIEEENILISIMGNVGDITITPKGFKPCIANRAICILKNIKTNPYFLFAYLISNTASLDIERLKTGGVQERINLEILQQLHIPIVTNDDFLKSIQDLIINSQGANNSSIKLLKNAEQLLLADLNLADYIPSDTNTSTRKLSDCLADDRFDAEYWQPKYDDITQAIKSYRNGFDTFDNLFVIGNQMTINPDEAYSYVELADVDSSLGTIENYTEMQGKELPSRGRMPLRKDDVIMSSLDGSLNKTALVTIDKLNIIGSTGFFVMRKKYFEPEVALVLLKSGLIQEIVGRQAQGTILTAIPKTSLSRILLPKIASDTQAKIKSLVIDAHKNKALAQLTLEKAKRAVEIFVEQDEAQALAYLAI